MIANRPIEFRVWHLPTQRLYLVDCFSQHTVYLPWDNAKTDSENYQVVDHPFARKDCVLMQFTGVCDDNGVKMYEGDIVYWQYYDERENELFESWYEVAFQKGEFGTIGIQGTEFNPFCERENIGDVVVGNIVEHADLLAICRSQVAV